MNCVVLRPLGIPRMTRTLHNDVYGTTWSDPGDASRSVRVTCFKSF
jgi:hypothetical protein